MARIRLPEGDQPEIYRAWTLRPVMAEAMGKLEEGIAKGSKLAPREHESIRMRIAQINDCPI